VRRPLGEAGEAHPEAARRQAGGGAQQVEQRDQRRLAGQPFQHQLAQPGARAGRQAGGQPHGFLRVAAEAAFGGAGLRQRLAIAQPGECQFQRVPRQHRAAREGVRHRAGAEIGHARPPGPLAAQCQEVVERAGGHLRIGRHGSHFSWQAGSCLNRLAALPSSAAR
jgi:hypothetical protein